MCSPAGCDCDTGHIDLCLLECAMHDGFLLHHIIFIYIWPFGALQGFMLSNATLSAQYLEVLLWHCARARVQAVAVVNNEVDIVIIHAPHGSLKANLLCNLGLCWCHTTHRCSKTMKRLAFLFSAIHITLWKSLNQEHMKRRHNSLCKIETIDMNTLKQSNMWCITILHQLGLCCTVPRARLGACSTEPQCMQ